jgi:dihydrofolate synthase / folylpolyglutamate synthase
MKFGLKGTHRLLQSLGNPHNTFPAIHIAGTNGKGSTASMLAAMFTAAGYKTGLYTSPHLIQFNERIRINGKPISSRDLSRLTTLIQTEVVRGKNTFFEAATAIGFQYFAEQKVDIAIIETGLGGRLDATNVLKPLVSVITTIGLEHTHILGKTIQKIAREKAGIVKSKTFCITAVADTSARKVIATVCKKRSAPFHIVQSKQIHIHRSSLLGVTADFDLASHSLSRVTVSLPGTHQAMNALLSLSVVEEINNEYQFYISERAVRKALGNIQRYSGLQARLSIIQKTPVMIVADVAHNPDAIQSLCSSLQSMYRKKFRVVFGLMQDKNLLPMIPALSSLAETITAVQARTERSRSVQEIAMAFQQSRIPVKQYSSVARGLRAVFREDSSIPILIVGSHFVVGEALAVLQRKKYLTINQ